MEERCLRVIGRRRGFKERGWRLNERKGEWGGWEVERMVDKNRKQK